HLVGHIHQPLHSAQVFTTDYPKGDRGGNQICARQSVNRTARELHSFWYGVVTSGSTIPQLREQVTVLRNRPEFARDQLTELASSSFDSWAKESFEIATKIAYQNGAIPGTAKNAAKSCSDV